MPTLHGIAPSGFRLPDETHVGAVRLQVRSLERSVDYYTATIGLRVHTEHAGAAGLAPHGNERVLVWLHERADAIPSPKRGVYGLYHFAILLPDRRALGRFMSHLAARDVRVGMSDHLVSEALYLWDPDGLGIEVYADRPRNTWTYDGRQLVMAIDPLDVENLMAAGGGQQWEGVPADTTIGHVHLHVGNLDDAERFYHRALGFDKTAWSYPGALFLSAGGYHHHLGTNTWAPGPSARPDHARLLEWELIVPQHAVALAERSLRGSGYDVDSTGIGVGVADPWGTRLLIRTVTT